MRYLVTGHAGFAGTHLCRALRGDGHHVTGFDLRDGQDIRSYEQVRDAVEGAEPDRIIHLAAAAWPGESLIDPQRHLDVNAGGTLKLLQAMRACGSDARILIAGTSEEYGYEGRDPDDVLTGDSPCRPTTPYGVSKLAATTMGMVYARRWGLPVVVTRAFNHTGHGRQAVNAESAFARRIVQAERGAADHVAHGDLSARRNFSHVCDIVAGYRIAAELPPGIYNIASPSAVTLREVMETLLGMSSVPGIPLKQDPRYGRADQAAAFPAVDVSAVTAAGWAPKVPLRDALADVLDYWRSR